MTKYLTLFTESDLPHGCQGIISTNIVFSSAGKIPEEITDNTELNEKKGGEDLPAESQEVEDETELRENNDYGETEADDG